MADNDVSPASVQEYLGGIDYPANKGKLMQTARDQNAPQEVLDLLGKIDAKEYNGPTDVTEQLGEYT